MTNMKIKVVFFYFNIINILIEFVTYIGVWKRINKSNVIFFAYVKYIKRCYSIENRAISNCFFQIRYIQIEVSIFLFIIPVIFTSGFFYKHILMKYYKVSHQYTLWWYSEATAVVKQTRMVVLYKQDIDDRIFSDDGYFLH